MASPLDFTLSDEGELPATRGKWPAPAYCLNQAEQQVLFAICPDDQCVFEAPFFWQAQHQRATHIATVPFERLNEFVDVMPRNPVFVFSIGRCGSTLLSALLRASGARSVSEPDLLTQLARPAPNGPRKMPPSLRRLLIETCVASLAAQPATIPIVLKLRSQCNAIAREIAHAFPDGTYVIMMRDRHTWLRSQLRALGGDPRVLASSYRRGLQTFHDLQADGANSLLMWYEDLVGDPENAIRQVKTIPPGSAGIADISSVIELDSQAGTVLQRNKIARKSPTAEQVRIFDEEWERIRPDSWIERYGIDRLR